MDWKSIRIEQGDSLPYYMQLAREIRRLILTGRIPLGERIPVSRELMKIFKFSSTTVEKGIGILVEEGFLVRRPRIGTFVAKRFRSSRAVSGSTPAKSRCFLRISFHTGISGSRFSSSLSAV